MELNELDRGRSMMKSMEIEDNGEIRTNNGSKST
jgi:hypothetical protein